MIMSFLDRDYLLNQTYITLIPKGELQQTSTQFRPKSLYNIVYKFITKVLVFRLQRILDKLIIPYHNALIKGRIITNNIILTIKIM